MPDKEFGVLTTVAKEHADKDRVVRFTGTTGIRDRQGDEISVRGWDFEHYLKNPVVPWAHKYDEPPVGRVTDIAQKKDRIEFDVEFAPADVHPKAEQIFQLTKRGFINGVSVGFRSLDSEWIDTETEEEKLAKDTPDARAGKRFKKTELLELSIVPVPCNPEALIAERQKGMELPDELNTYLDMFDALRKSQEAGMRTRIIKSKLESDNEPETGEPNTIYTDGAPDPQLFKDYLEVHADEVQELLHKLFDELEEIRGLIHELKQGSPDLDFAQPANGEAETVESEDVATDADSTAPPDPGDAETKSEGGPEHISNKFRLVE